MQPLPFISILSLAAMSETKAELKDWGTHCMTLKALNIYCLVK